MRQITNIDIEIVPTELILIHDRYKTIIVDELRNILSLTKHNKGLDIQITSISIGYKKGNPYTPCTVDDAQLISVNIKFNRIDHTKYKEIKTYQKRGYPDSHLGIQIFLPNKIKQRRGQMIDSILNNLDN